MVPMKVFEKCCPMWSSFSHRSRRSVLHPGLTYNTPKHNFYHNFQPKRGFSRERHFIEDQLLLLIRVCYYWYGISNDLSLMIFILRLRHLQLKILNFNREQKLERSNILIRNVAGVCRQHHTTWYQICF